MSVEIIVSEDSFSLDVKRCYMPIVIKAPCPKCGTVVTRDLSSHYESYPVFNEDTTLSMYHDGDEDGEDPSKYCNTSWKIPVRFGLTLNLI